MSPFRVCAEPRCPEPCAENSTRCEAHRLERNRETRAVFRNFYGSKRWELQRERVLSERPLCEYLENGKPCGRVGQAVHHIQELTQGGAERDASNLQVLCYRHHALVHSRRRATAT